MTGSKTALIMAGGTGGHIFPGLAVAEALRARGWRVHWVGGPASMEARIAAQHGFALESVTFSGVRGKGLATLALLPLRLLRAFWQARAVLRRVQPDVLVGLGGYISFPGALMGLLRRKPLVLHEQNAVAGLANRLLAGRADRVFAAFPGAFGSAAPKARWVGNPLRAAFTQQAGPAERFAARPGPLPLLLMTGSLCPPARHPAARGRHAAARPAGALCGAHRAAATAGHGRQPGRARAQRTRAAGAGAAAGRAAPAGAAPKRRHADRGPARPLRRRRGAGRAQAVLGRRGVRAGRRRCHRLPRGRQHRQRNRCRGRCGAVRAAALGGRRPPHPPPPPPCPPPPPPPP